MSLHASPQPLPHSPSPTPKHEPRKSSILWQNPARSVLLIDIPRSLEESQVPSAALSDAVNPKQLRRIISTNPLEAPFNTPEPKNDAQQRSSPSAQVAELMTRAAVEAALEEVRSGIRGARWCLRRVTRGQSGEELDAEQAAGDKGRLVETQNRVDNMDVRATSHAKSHALHPGKRRRSPLAGITVDTDGIAAIKHHIPPSSHHLLGTLPSTMPSFLAATPTTQFDLILLDPPWPNHSARRNRGPSSYRPSQNFASLRTLLASIPLSRLSPTGLAAVWITNSPRCLDVLNDLFVTEWATLEPATEWVWLKVTAAGQPIVHLDSKWRKPWERLVVARRTGGKSVNSRVIVGVPDLHSRKPNLRDLFNDYLGEGYVGLEVFARNLTAGWWSLGDEVLRFQETSAWVDQQNAE